MGGWVWASGCGFYSLNSVPPRLLPPGDPPPPLLFSSQPVFTLWQESILPRLIESESVLVVGHSNTIRAMVIQLDSLSDSAIVNDVIPSAIPLVYNFAQDSTGLVHPLGRKSSVGMRGRFVVTRELLELNLAASQNLEMSENLDEDAGSFKEALSMTLKRVGNVDGHGDGAGAGGTGRRVGSSFMDADLIGSQGAGAGGRVMEAGWMTSGGAKGSNHSSMRDT